MDNDFFIAPAEFAAVYGKVPRLTVETVVCVDGGVVLTRRSSRTSMPGLGIRTSLKILTIVGDGTAFPSAAHLAAYAGLAPVTRRSGSSINGETRSRRGNRALKNALFQSAFASLSDPTRRAYYDRKRTEKKKHNAAIVCLARRRTDVIYAMLRDMRP